MMAGSGCVTGGSPGAPVGAVVDCAVFRWGGGGRSARRPPPIAAAPPLKPASLEHLSLFPLSIQPTGLELRTPVVWRELVNRGRASSSAKTPDRLGKAAPTSPEFLFWRRGNKWLSLS